MTSATGSPDRVTHAESTQAPALRLGEPRRRAPLRRPSLVWWVFVANGAVLGIGLLLLTFSPVTVSAPIRVAEFAVLATGLIGLLVLNLLLLRGVMTPLVRLAELMASVDADRPGRRLAVSDARTAEEEALVDAFNAMLERLEAARSDATRSALAAQETERLRVARELHDEVGQTLTAAIIETEGAADHAAEATRERLGRVVATLRDGLEDVRRISRELRPEALDDLGLANAVLALCSRVDDQSAIRVRRRLDGRLPALSDEAELVVYRVAQESLTNATRHSQASTVEVSLVVRDAALTLVVEDDGIGMPGTLSGDTSGIAGMRERALLIRGALTIDSIAGRGTTVTLTVPLDPEQP